MKVQLFDADDLKLIEDAMFNALVRAMRVALKENLIQGLAPAAKPVEPAVARPPVTPIKPPAPVAVPPAPPPPTAGERRRNKARSARDVCKVQAERPHGYITLDQARDLIGRDNATQVSIGRWVINKEIPAVIVTSIKPPTKGLPGRLVVDKECLLARDLQRKENVLKLPALARFRKSA